MKPGRSVFGVAVAAAMLLGVSATVCVGRLRPRPAPQSPPAIVGARTAPVPREQRVAVAEPEEALAPLPYRRPDEGPEGGRIAVLDEVEEAVRRAPEPARPEERPAPPAAAGRPSPPDATPPPPPGLAGKALFKGKPPKRKQIRRYGDPYCEALGEEKVVSEEVVVNDNGTLRNVYVRITGGLGDRSFAPPEKPFVLRQKDCRYEPRVFGIVAGQKLKVVNDDDTCHNVRVRSRINADWNFSQRTKGEERVVGFDRPEAAILITCDVHPWMGTWCFVERHPYFAVTGAEGTFHIPGVPRGEYEVEAWHERMGTLKAKASVKPRAWVEFAFEGEK
jgi:plastocyanin